MAYHPPDRPDPSEFTYDLALHPGVTDLTDLADDPTEADSGLFTLNVLLIGFLGAFVVLSSQMLTLVPHMLMTLVHELGHTVAGWLFGYPTIPALDFMYGGGVAIHGERNTLVLLLAAAGGAYLVFRVRHNAPAFILGGLGFALMASASMTSAHQFLIAGAGHWAELLFGGIFLYRAMSGSAVVYKIERPLYAWLGAFFVLYNVRFSYRLLTNPYYRQLYDEGKATVHRMDFSRMAEEFLHVDLSKVVMVHLALCIVPMASAIAAHMTRSLWRPVLAELLDPTPETNTAL